MPNTRKKAIKTVYKDEDSDEEGGDFSDSGSEAKITDVSSSEDDEIASEYSSADEFQDTSTNIVSKRKCPPKKKQSAKTLAEKINKQINNEKENVAHFSIKDLTEADKLLPFILNLSESDSSDDESPKTTNRNNSTFLQTSEQNVDSDMDVSTEYKDVWSLNIQTPDNSEEIARKTFTELEQHKSNLEETKAALQNYQLKTKQRDSDVKDLLAMGEEQIPEIKTVTRKPKFKKRKDDSDSDIEDWEEVKETKEIPKQGIQLFVEFPDGGCRKSKKIDVEMMMKRKINRVKKEYQVYMHKVHVLCWLGHGNYVSRILNDQELMAAALSLVPSKECYPGERVDMKYVEQITTWYKDKLTLKQDKNEDKFKPKAPPLKTILLDLIKRRIVTSKKYLVFIFVIMLRTLGLQCRVMFNFVTLPIKPPHSELCSLSTKPKDVSKSLQKAKVVKSEDTKTNSSSVKNDTEPKASTSKVKSRKQKITQLDGNYDSSSSNNEEMLVCFDEEAMLYADLENIMQVDGNDDTLNIRRTRSTKRPKADTDNLELEDVSPPKIPRKSAGRNTSKSVANADSKITNVENKRTQRGKKINDTKDNCDQIDNASKVKNTRSIRISRLDKATVENNGKIIQKDSKSKAGSTINKSKAQKSNPKGNESSLDTPKINVVDENNKLVSSKFFEDSKSVSKLFPLSRKRSQTTNPVPSKGDNMLEGKDTNVKVKGRTKSAPGTDIEKSKYFDSNTQKAPKEVVRKCKAAILEDKLRVSHKELTRRFTTKKENDITGDLVSIMKNRIKDEKNQTKKELVKGKVKEESDGDSDYLPIEDSKQRNSDSEDDFKPTKITPKHIKSARRIDRRVISSSPDVETINPKKIDVWCEIFVEELEQWISVDVIKGKIHSTGELYTNATHPVCYIVGWDNNNYLKDLTRKYVPHYNTVTRKIRAEHSWWNKAVSPYLGPKTARDREEDEYLDRMQLEAPLPKSIAEYKNHPLYALKRHLLKFEAIYPADAAVLGFVRNEPVYARECVYVCRSRDIWLKEAKVVRLGEQPYKVVKARPKWDKLSNKLITDKPLEVFGPWQVQDYEPPVAENGVVPRNAYGNVELFKDCMLPKGTVHIKLPGLNRVAKKLNIDCAPAMIGFDYNGGWSHPVYDGFVVCEEFADIVRDAWVKDQEEQERREREKTELRVYGNWKKLIKGLLIRERLKNKYGFEKPSTASTSKGKSKAPRLIVKKK